VLGSSRMATFVVSRVDAPAEPHSQAAQTCEVGEPLTRWLSSYGRMFV
jgi:hypothetical protein